MLRENGEIVGPDGATVDPAGALMLILSRALCRFHLFAVPQGMRGRQVERAARFHTETRAPFRSSDALLQRHPAGAAIWWWDADQVRALIDGRWRYVADRLLPETLLQPSGAGWLQRRVADGYEAQYWSGGALQASAWRRRPFEEGSWVAFRMGIEHDDPAAWQPPDPEPSSLPPVIGALPARLRPGLGWPQIERSALLLALAGAGVASWSMGQTLRYAGDARADLARAEQVRRLGALDVGQAHMLRDLAIARDFAAQTVPADPLGIAADAFAILRSFGVQTGDWRIDETEFRVEILDLPDHVSIRDVASSIEEHPCFAAVSERPTGIDGSIVLQADVMKGGRPARVAAPMDGAL
ncbi:hypothetical protein CLG96_08205 [Sphingomonas oleivorans]|uniref:Uncharacterized protein n=1 Tax=Sphingomonas oleivorans TaxID=1735121 RepID=A0A2T5FY09_9SPHN|nr:hypothetical protein CLG96_08205 [Sphingomonas oleivorans]